jgi:hypothetical protein
MEPTMHTISRKVDLLAGPVLAVATAAMLVVALITPDASILRPCRAARSGRGRNITRCLTHPTLAETPWRP